MKSLIHAFALVSCGLALTGCQPKPAAAAKAETTPAITVRTRAVERRPVPRALEVTGELKSGRISAVAADAAGKVRETLVERGSVVKAGDVLVKLDDRAAKLALREAEAGLAQAQARLALAQGDWKRNQQLADSKLIAVAESQKFQAEARASEADVALAEARRDNARKGMEDTEVRAPFAGTVVERLTNAGEFLQPGARVAVLIAQQDLRLWLNVPEVAAGAIREGQVARFRVPAFPGAEFAAKVRYISPIVRESGRDLLVEAEVENPEGKLRQGMFAEARLMLTDTPGLVVPVSAVRKDGTVHKVLVPEGEHLAERIVEVGVTTDAWTEIRNGVAEGEAVVTELTQEIRDGARFTLAAR